MKGSLTLRSVVGYVSGEIQTVNLQGWAMRGQLLLIRSLVDHDA